MTTALVTLAATSTSEHIDANCLAVPPAVFARICAESAHPAGLGSPDELHITVNTDDAAELNALDDLLRERGRAVADFVGAECVALFPRQGIDGCDVWARVKVEDIVG